MLTLTMIRHAESTDNVKSVWAGWKDAPLSNHGMNQARALALALQELTFVAIHCSDLKRTITTAEAIQEKQSTDCQTAIIPSQLLREQHFGAGEGKPFGPKKPKWTPEQHYTAGIFPSPNSRDGKFPGGESKNDMRVRAQRAVEELFLPYLSDATFEGHVAVVSHGLFLRELLRAFLSIGNVDEESGVTGLDGLKNTAWIRLTVKVIEPLEERQYRVRVLSYGNSSHLTSVVSDNERKCARSLMARGFAKVRQKGGIGSSAHDPKQKDIRSFFGGGSDRN